MKERDKIHKRGPGMTEIGTTEVKVTSPEREIPEKEDTPEREKTPEIGIEMIEETVMAGALEQHTPEQKASEEQTDRTLTEIEEETTHTTEGNSQNQSITEEERIQETDKETEMIQ